MQLKPLAKNKSVNQRAFGAYYELAAQHWLQQHQLKVIAKNFTCTVGEIDLIATDRNELVFVEVRFRKSNDHGGPLESVTPTKQRKIHKAALYFLQNQRAYYHYPCRFDVIAISPKDPKKPAPDHFKPTDLKDIDLVWVKDAFQVRAW